MAAVLQIRHNRQLFNLFVIDLAIGVGNGTRTYLDDNPFLVLPVFPFPSAHLPIPTRLGYLRWGPSVTILKLKDHVTDLD